MYKRYLEPNDDNPLTKYMQKKLKTEGTKPNYKIQRRNTHLLNINASNQDLPDEPEFVVEETDNVELVNPNKSEKEETSGDETSDFFRTISDQLIHPKLECKTADAITMILAYFLQHHLTWVALEDLLKLFHNIMGDDSNLPKTKYLFRKCFGPNNQKTVIHFYCKKCMVYIDTYENLKSSQDNANGTDGSSGICTVCETEYSLKKLNDGNFFMELPLREQIEKKILEDTEILNCRPSSDTGDITDIFDGELYKSLRAKVGPVPLVTLTLNTDGVRVFKSKRKASLWPIQWIVNEVAPHKRYKRENIILSGIWFGSDPCFEIYFKPVIKEMNDLEERKIVINTGGSDKSVTVRVLLFSSDLPAKSKVLKFKQFNGEFGCSYCHHPGYLVGSSNSSKYTESDVVHTLRTHSGTLSLIRQLMLTGQDILGVMGISPLFGFKDFNLITGTVIDYLHCVLEGVTKLQLDLWFNSENHKEKYYVTPRRAELVNKNLGRITPPKHFSIKPRPIEEKEYWKAHELKCWLLYYAVPCLNGILPPAYLNHFTLLSEATFIFLKSKITRPEFEKASKNLLTFVIQFQKLYGEENMNHNVHLLKHIPKCVLDCGPLWAYSNFNFESNNGSLVRHVNGTTDVEHQIASKYHFNNSLNRLKNMCESTSSTFNYIDRMKSMRVKKSEKLGKITLLGSPHKHKLTSIEKALLSETDLEYTEAYYKFFHGSDIFFSATYKKAEQTDDTVVMLKDKRVGIISLIFKENESVFMLLQMLDIESVPQFPSHVKKVSMNNERFFEKVPAEDILEKLVMISTVKVSFVTSIPNRFECD